MNTLRIPKVINFGKDALSEAEYPKNALVVTTAPPALSGKWLDRMGIEDYMLYDKVTPEPSIDDVNGVISEFKSKDPSVIIGLGGGSSMDVVKYSAPEMGKEKILDPNHFFWFRDFHIMDKICPTDYTHHQFLIVFYKSFFIFCTLALSNIGTIVRPIHSSSTSKSKPKL